MLWPYCSHDGIPCGGEDVSVVVALIMSLQLLGEVLSGQLRQQPDGVEVSLATKIISVSFREHHWTQGLGVILMGNCTGYTHQRLFLGLGQRISCMNPSKQ